MDFPTGLSDSVILEVIARSPGMSITSLWRELTETHGLSMACSNLYTPIRRLEQKRILVREGDGYCLNGDWVDQLCQYSYLLQKAQDTRLTFPLDLYEERQWLVQNDKERESIWWLLQSRMIEASDEQAYYTYRSHSFWRPAVPAGNTLPQLPSAFHTYAIYGNDTFLDQHGIELSNLLGGSSVIAPDAPYPKEGYVLFVCGEYICDWSYHPTVSKAFADIFRNTESIHDFSVEEMRSLYTQEAPFSIDLRRNPEEAEKHRRIIRGYCVGEKAKGALLTHAELPEMPSHA